ncbi:MAG TPA: DUF6134 family protein [Alphaproteobacteria bacterium]|nr:DUF6134 family protein [Alphaproteobacteria bacterium]
MIRLRRRTLIASTAAAALLPLPGFAQAPARYAFAVVRGGDPMGTHTIDIAQAGDRTEVAIAIDLAVKFGPLTVFRYTHRNREVWQGGRLLALETTTDDDGTPHKVSAQATQQGLQVSGSGGSYLAPADTLPSSYWRPETVTRTVLLNTQEGVLSKVAFAPVAQESVPVAGRPVPAARHRMSGDIEGDLWYDAAGRWVALQFSARGSDVVYTLNTDPAPVGL